jgi:hypothetical protein
MRGSLLVSGGGEVEWPQLTPEEEMAMVEAEIRNDYSRFDNDNG